MNYQLRKRASHLESDPKPLTMEVVDNDGVVVAEGHLIADFTPGAPAESMVTCGVRFEGIAKAAS